jgi:sugar phosphate isomerase/epimerase
MKRFATRLGNKTLKPVWFHERSTISKASKWRRFANKAFEENIGNNNTNNSYILASGTLIISTASLLFSPYILADEVKEPISEKAKIIVAEIEAEEQVQEAETIEQGKVSNTILADRHRVSLCGWPILGARDNKDPRVKDITSLFEHVWISGYDGIEISVEDVQSMYPKVAKRFTSMEFANMLKEEADEHGIQIFGSLYLVVDGTPVEERLRPHDMDFSEDDFWVKMEEKLRCDRAAGAEYVTYQICLPPKYMNTGGAYRGDEAYYLTVVERIERLTQLCHGLNLNVYFETHINHISEDPIAFAEIINLYEDTYGRKLELNGNFSHYIYRGITKGESIDNILNRVQHMHQTMARPHGGLSVDVIDPIEDWNNKGVTYEAFEMTAKVLKNVGGLSSRTISGESGPFFLDKDPLTNDAKMIPLLRAMCSVADGELDYPLKRNPFIE